MTNPAPKKKPTPEERADQYYREFMAKQRSDIPTAVLKDAVVDQLAKDIADGEVSDDAKQRAATAFTKVDDAERRRANEQMRSGQFSFDVGEFDLTVALAGVDEEGNYSRRDTARCRIGVIGMDEYLRWDYLQDANRRAANEAYDRGKARFAPYLPHFQRGLTVEQIHEQGLISPPEDDA